MERSLIYFLQSVAPLNLNQTQQTTLGDLSKTIMRKRNLSLRQSIGALNQCKLSTASMTMISYFFLTNGRARPD